MYHLSVIVRVIKSKSLRLTEYLARKETFRSASKILTGKKHLGKLKHRWQGNIRIDTLEFFGSGQGLLETYCEIYIVILGFLVNGVTVSLIIILLILLLLLGIMCNYT